MNVHFIAIGGSAMHNLAIALHKKGYIITGSDDEIFNPAKTNLDRFGLLPENIGWFPEKIHSGLDAVILGMHAREDNPELIKARQIGLKIYSYPEYLYEQSKNKLRIVIGGSHGKTTITAMILHVFKTLGIEADYMVGAQLEGFEVMVRLSDSAKFMVIEGDEYLTSALDRRPKFHVYKPDIGLISGIAWDHVNVFPTFDNYIDQFRIFAGLIPENGYLIYCNEDINVRAIAGSPEIKCILKPYETPKYYISEGVTHIIVNGNHIGLKIFGEHNMQNLEGARLVCETAGVNKESFYNAISTFSGASKRLELIAYKPSAAVFKDFAHSPSKLKATIKAVKDQFPDRKLIACMELHTFSSLNIKFLSEYKNTMDMADTAIVFYSRHALELKRLSFFSAKDVAVAFDRPDIKVFNEKSELRKYLEEIPLVQTNLLLMSSGNFDGMNLNEMAQNLFQKK